MKHPVLGFVGRSTVNESRCNVRYKPERLGMPFWERTVRRKLGVCRAEATVADMVARDRYMSVTEDQQGYEVLGSGFIITTIV